MHHFIYSTINLINKKFYIGKHSCENIDDGYLGSGKILKRAIKKYGKDNFLRIDLDFFENEEEAFLAEKEIVNKDFLGLFRETCYNIGEGGFGGDNLTSHPNRENIIKKITESIKQRWKDPEYHARVNKKRAEAMRTDGYRKLRSDIATKLWENDDYKNKTTYATRTAMNTAECKATKSKVSKELWQNQEYKEKMISVFNTEENRKRNSERVKKAYKEDPNIIQRQTASRKITLALPENKKRMSEASKLKYKNSSKMQFSLTKGRMGEKNPSWGSKWMHNPETKERLKIPKDKIEQALKDGLVFGRLRVK